MKQRVLKMDRIDIWPTTTRLQQWKRYNKHVSRSTTQHKEGKRLSLTASRGKASTVLTISFLCILLNKLQIILFYENNY